MSRTLRSRDRDGVHPRRRRSNRSHLRLFAAVGIGLFSSVFALTSASASDPQTDVSTAWTNTNAQPEIQIDGTTSFSGSFTDEAGQDQTQGEDDTFVGELERDNGGYDELLKDSASGASNATNTLFVQGDGTFYYQDGGSWQNGGSGATNTLQDEASILQNLTDVHSGPSPSGGVQYTASLTAQKIVTMLNTYASTGPNQNPFDSLLNRIGSESNSSVRIDTTNIDGSPVIDEVQMLLAVNLTVPDTVGILGIGGDTTKMKGWQFHFSYDYKNAFASQVFANPITGKTPDEPTSSGGTSNASSGSSSGSTSTNSTGSSTSAGVGVSAPGSSSGTTTQPTKPVTHLTAAQVTKAYMDAFDIGPSTAQSNQWTSVDNLTVDQLMQKLRQIIKSDAITRKNITVLSYMDAFGRSPTDAELTYWVNRLASSGEDYTDEMGFNRQYLESNDAMRQSMVTRAYQAVFWRGPTNAETKYWDTQIKANGMFFTELLADQKYSFQHLASMREGAVINAYLTYLGTKPSTAELNSWSGVIQARSITTYPDLIKLMDSPLRYKVKTDASVRENLITAAYWTVFWRGPDAGELKYWDNRLRTTNGIFQDLVLNNMAFLAENASMRDAAIDNAHVVVVGRNAMKSELSSWGRQIQNGSIRTYADLVDQVKSSVEARTNLQDDIINRAYQWTFGRAAQAGEVKFWKPYLKNGQVDYTELVKRNRAYIQQNASARDDIIQRSYEQVFHRAPTAGELAFWDGALKKYGDTYQELVQSHENWLNANRAALNADGTLKANLSSVHLFVDSTGNLVSTKTNKVVIPASEWLIGQRASNGNLIGIDGTGVIPAGAGNVIAAGGGNVIAAGAGNVIAAGGGNVIGAGGGNVMAPNASGLIVNLANNLVQIDAAANMNAGLIPLLSGSRVIAAGGGNVIGAGAGN